MSIIFTFINVLNNLLVFPKRGFTRNHVDKFMYSNFKNVKKNLKILDVGAGYKPYKYFFKECNYESCDFDVALSDIGDGDKYEQDFYCDITKKIPKDDNTYDIVICNEVLEHINEPSDALKEIYRIIKPGGKLFITTTQCHGLHQEPHNYFNYLSYGLEYILKKNKFRSINIFALGGIFHLLGKVLQNTLNFTFYKKSIIRIILYPLEFALRILLLIISFILFYADSFDRMKKWTINYGCICTK